jgi:hypothetical protein
MNYLEKFNTTFIEFINDIIRIFPEDPDIQIYKAAIETAIALDPKFIITRFNETLVKDYGKELLERNDNFFINYNYTDIIAQNQGYNAIITKIKNAWVQMNNENKEVIWKYFKILILLATKFVLKDNN